MKVVLTTLNAKYTHTSLALRCLRAYCGDLCPIRIVEFTINQPILDIVRELYVEAPDVIGVSCSIWNAEMTIQLVGILKKILPETVIVCGGPEISYAAERFLTRCPSVDYVILGEGEAPLRALLAALAVGKELGRIASVLPRDASSTELSPAVVGDLSTLPFPYIEDEMGELKEKILYYESSRGCPFACQYCLSSATRGVRFLPTARVLEELRFFIAHGVRQVKFVDRTFNANSQHCLEILRFLSEQDCRTNFHFEIAADSLNDEIVAVLEGMPKGRVQFEIGVQSTNPQTLDAIRRRQNWDKIVYYVEKLCSLGTMHLHLDLIVGLPYEDLPTFRRSFNDVYVLRPHMLQIGFLKMLPGAGITREADTFGYVYMDTAPYQVLANQWMMYGEIRKLGILEAVFEAYHNSGRFRYTQQFCVASVSEPFAFYEQFAAYWETRRLHLTAHAAKALYGYLSDFWQETHPETVDQVKALLKLDALTDRGDGTRPKPLDWNERIYEAETTAFFRDAAPRYLSNYRFTTWRDIKKKYHIEVFSFDVVQFTRGGRLETELTPVLFEYPEEGGVRMQTIKANDFWRGNELR